MIATSVALLVVALLSATLAWNCAGPTRTAPGGAAVRSVAAVGVGVGVEPSALQDGHSLSATPLLQRPAPDGSEPCLDPGLATCADRVAVDVPPDHAVPSSRATPMMVIGMTRTSTALPVSSAPAAGEVSLVKLCRSRT